MMNEQISAWIDGELSEGEARRVHEVVTRQTAMQMQCGTLWLIGDVMRDEATLSASFTERVMAALNDEPTVLAPVVMQSVSMAKPAQRWMPLAAGVAGVAAVAWVAMAGINARQTAVPVMAAAQPQVQQLALKSGVRQADDDRPYLMAHQAYGPGVQMAGVSGYVRPVSLDEPIASR